MKSAVLVCWQQSPWDIPSRVEGWRGSSSLATPPSQLNGALLCLHVASGCWGRARVYRLEKTRKKGLHLCYGKTVILTGYRPSSLLWGRLSVSLCNSSPCSASESNKLIASQGEFWWDYILVCHWLVRKR